MAFKTTISRANGGLPKSVRSNVPAHALFQNVKDGRTSGAVFGNLGYSRKMGRYYSLAVQDATAGKDNILHGSDNGSKAIALVGTFEFEADMFRPGREVMTTRSKLVPGDIFQVPGSRAAKTSRYHKPPLYVNLGAINSNRNVLSYNLNTKQIAVGSKLQGKVRKVGTTAINKTMAA